MIKSKKVTFIIQGLLISLILYFSINILLKRYHIAIDTQSKTSLPYRLYIVDIYDKNIKEGKYYAFLSPDIYPFFSKNTKMIKMIVSMPKDVVYVDGKKNNLIKNKIFSIPNKYTNKNNEYWVIGYSENSIDSRYFGTIKGDKILGRAYPII